jgi:iron-sulfur cluster repair protein YtfE (RIC family)
MHGIEDKTRENVPGSGYKTLIALAQKVAHVHGARHAELAELASLVEQAVLDPSPTPETRRRLASIRGLASDFTPPADACDSYRALYRGLERMEGDFLARFPRTEDSRHESGARPAGDAGTDAPGAASCCGL